MKRTLSRALKPRLTALFLVVSALGLATPARGATEKEIPKMETYDLRAKNPVGDKLSALALDTKAAFKAISLSIPAGKELPEHTTPTPAVLFMLEGEARFITASEEISLTPGKVVHIPPEVPHRVVAVRDSQLVLIK